MSLEDLKIKDSDISSHGVVAAPDKLMGTAQENKAVFDRLIRVMLSQRFNALIDSLGSGGAMSETILRDVVDRLIETEMETLIKEIIEQLMGDETETLVKELVEKLIKSESFIEEIVKETTEKVIEQGGGYDLPTASAETLGGIKVGEGLAIDEEGRLSVPGLADVEAALDAINGEVV